MALQWKKHANNPAAQSFNLKGHPNRTKKRAWWQIGKSNNKKQR